MTGPLDHKWPRFACLYIRYHFYTKGLVINYRKGGYKMGKSLQGKTFCTPLSKGVPHFGIDKTSSYCIKATPKLVVPLPCLACLKLFLPPPPPPPFIVIQTCCTISHFYKHTAATKLSVFRGQVKIHCWLLVAAVVLQPLAETSIKSYTPLL